MGKPVQQSDMEFYYQDMELLQPPGKIHPTWQTENLSKIIGQPSSKTQLLCAVVRPCISSTTYCTEFVQLLTSSLRIHTILYGTPAMCDAAPLRNLYGLGLAW